MPLADGTRTIAEIAARASEEMDAETSEELVRLALDELRGSGLLEVTEGDVTAGSQLAAANAERSVISRRAMLGRLGVVPRHYCRLLPPSLRQRLRKLTSRRNLGACEVFLIWRE